jgi:hypothetical protein
MNPNLFQTLEQCLKNNNALAGPTTPVIQKGSLVKFGYLYAKPGHDQTPMVLITDIWPAYIRGLNLNYLTFPIIKGLLQQFGEKPTFSYQNIKGQDYIVSAFRQYKRPGISAIQKLNSPFLLNALACARSTDPSEVEQMRKVIRDQLRQQTNPSAAPSAEMPVGGNPTQQQPPAPGV